MVAKIITSITQLLVLNNTLYILCKKKFTKNKYKHSLYYLQINNCVLSVQVYDETARLRITNSNNMPNNPLICMVVGETSDHTLIKLYSLRPILHESSEN